MIPGAAVEAAMLAFAEAPYEPPTSPEQVNLNNRAQMTLALEAAAPHMGGYKWPVGDDDNPHRDGDVQPRRHWLVNSDTGWECSGCDWTGAILKDYWTAHEKLDEYQVPF